MIFGINTTRDISKLSQNFTRLTAREITCNNFEISLVIFMPNITTNHAITYTKTSYFADLIFKRYSKLFKNCLKDSYSKLPVSFCSAIKFVYNFFLKDLTFFTFFTSMDSSFQFLIVCTLKVRPPSGFFLKTGQWKFKFAKRVDRLWISEFVFNIELI